MGLNPVLPAGGFNPEIAKAARAYEGPSAVVVARGVHNDDPIGGAIKILTPIAGTAFPDALRRSVLNSRALPTLK